MSHIALQVMYYNFIIINIWTYQSVNILTDRRIIPAYLQLIDWLMIYNMKCCIAMCWTESIPFCIFMIDNCICDIMNSIDRNRLILCICRIAFVRQFVHVYTFAIIVF